MELSWLVEGRKCSRKCNRSSSPFNDAIGCERTDMSPSSFIYLFSIPFAPIDRWRSVPPFLRSYAYRCYSEDRGMLGSAEFGRMTMYNKCFNTVNWNRETAGATRLVDTARWRRSERASAIVCIWRAIPYGLFMKTDILRRRE